MEMEAIKQIEQQFNKERIRCYQRGLEHMKEYFMKMLSEKTDISDIHLSKIEKHTNEAIKETIKDAEKRIINNEPIDKKE